MAEGGGSKLVGVCDAGACNPAGGRLGAFACVIAVLALTALTASSTVASAKELSEERKQALQHLLRHDCGSCHGLHLNGGLGPALTPAALEDKSNAALEATVLHGRPGTPMPPWQPLLTLEEVRWLVDTLKAGVRP